MCNLYRMTSSRSEVAKWFEAADRLGGANFGAEVFPGYPGSVVAQGQLRQMTWGFPLAMKGRQGQPLKPKPVNNARTDKLDSFFWHASFETRRCLIPLTAWAEAEGPKGARKRSWLSRPDCEIFAAAGIWRGSDEWGEVYAMVMTDAAGLAAELHTRMPVLLRRPDYDTWTSGTSAEARALCRPFDGELALDRTDRPWSGGTAQASLL